MCPGCFATISMIVAGVISSGGATVLAMKTLGRRNVGGDASGVMGKPGKPCVRTQKQRRSRHDTEYSGTSKGWNKG